MTRQEAIKILKSKMDGSVDTSYKWTEAVRMAIEALEQETVPSEDCINRYSALAELDPLSYEYKEIKELPSVVSSREEPKRGKWVLDEEVSKKHIEPIYVCSACKNYAAWGDTEKTPFCPNCGARMEDGKE